MKKGYTLVELLAVIAILALIMTLISVSVIQIYNKRKIKEFDELNSIIISNAKIIAETKSDLSDEIDYIISSRGSCKLNINILANERLIDNDLINPKTGQPLTGYVIISSGNQNTFEYGYEFTDEPTSSQQQLYDCIEY